MPFSILFKRLFKKNFFLTLNELLHARLDSTRFFLLILKRQRTNRDKFKLTL